MDTEITIRNSQKDFFEDELAEKLNLVRVSAPLFVRPESGPRTITLMVWNGLGSFEVEMHWRRRRNRSAFPGQMEEDGS